MTRLIAICTLFLLAAAPAHAKNINASGAVRADLLNRALEAQKIHAKQTKDTGRLVIVDYSRHSKEKRLFVVNLETGDVTGFRAAHGRGSDTDHDGFLDRFSDEPGSNASPEGALVIAEEYRGKHGLSLRLDGLDETDKSSRDRAIVIHAADYAEPDFLSRFGKLGRSNGCIVFSKADLKRFLAEVPKGTLMFVSR
ncbi:murein L,D-transpeptidase catalytic domain-containing protein [Hyphomonas sp.]|uniref:murein L,D-transpeptidase catalytic domain-containing protein n=1 Tax=Hyphomonas sp. TaxID=87 RepID=UPI0030F6A84D